jgi:hypothetical protein
MRYAYEVQSDGRKTIHVFADESSRVEWIAASPSTRGVLSGNSKEVKGALYRGVAIFADDPSEGAFTLGEAKQHIKQGSENF